MLLLNVYHVWVLIARTGSISRVDDVEARIRFPSNVQKKRSRSSLRPASAQPGGHLSCLPACGKEHAPGMDHKTARFAVR